MDPTSQKAPLRRGWTTGACATAAAKAAFIALHTGDFPDPIEIALPGGKRPSFALATTRLAHDGAGSWASATVVKDAGDDPDVTHGALICAGVRLAAAGAGVVFRAGSGVGVVTKPGLPLAVGEAAINPAPRRMMRLAIAEVAAQYRVAADVEIEISVPGGEALAAKTMNPRLGILGGISILGTTGVVIPYSCSAWIHSIYRGIDVARATGLTHVAGATGKTSEQAVQQLYGLPESALIDMGDFVGGMLKYLRKRPVARVTIAGGFAKMTKLAQGLLDLHSKRGSVDLPFLARLAAEAGGSPETSQAIAEANTALHALQIAEKQGINLPQRVAERAWTTVAETLAAGTLAGTALTGSGVALEIVVFGREGQLLARTPPRDLRYER